MSHQFWLYLPEQSKWRVRFFIELKFGTQIPHLNVTKVTKGTFEILLGAE